MLSGYEYVTIRSDFGENQLTLVKSPKRSWGFIKILGFGDRDQRRKKKGGGPAL